MTEPTEQPSSMLSPRKIVLQVLFWLVGLALLAWVVKGAFDKGGGLEMWHRIRAAPPLLIATLLGCTLASAVFNGTTFWITVQPLRKVRWSDMLLINVVANALNYAPVRLGALARIAYHLRVDRLTIIQIGGWFALIAYILFLGIGSTITATLATNRIDWIWLMLVLAQMLVGGAAIRFVASIPFIARRARNLDQLALNKPGVWGAIGLRVLDLGAYVGRMGAAMMILDMHLPWSNVVVLAMIALASSLMPVGRVGVREFCVAAAAARMNIDVTLDKGMWDQLALLESAGEALAYIPLGIMAIPWFRARWKNARPYARPLKL